jgi:hypothetical protein
MPKIIGKERRLFATFVAYVVVALLRNVSTPVVNENVA